MGSIPLPALDIGRQQAADPLGDIGKVVALRQLGQRAQLGQVELQQKNLELQQQQQMMQDRQTVMQALAAHQGNLTAALPELAGKVSPQSYIPLQQHDAQMREQLAKASVDELKVQDDKNSKLMQLVDTAQAMPPDQYAQQYPQIAAAAKQLRPELPIDPNQPIPQQALGQLKIGLQTAQQYLDSEKNRRANAEESRAAAKAPSELASSIAGAQLKQEEAANPPMSESQLYLKAAGGDPMAAVKLQTAQKIASRPINMSMTNLLQDQTALDQQAERFAQTGQLPAGFSRSPATTAAIIKRSAELHPGQNLASNSAEYKANEGSLKKLQTNFDQVSAFEGTALKNLDLFVQKASAIPDLGVRFANVPLRQITGKMIGEKNQAALNAARQTAATEAAKVLGSATASGVLSDTQKKDALDVLDGNLPMPAMVEVVNTLKQDFANRHASYDAQIGAIKSRMGGTSQPATAAPASSAPVTKVYQGVTYAQQPDGSWKKQ